MTTIAVTRAKSDEDILESSVARMLVQTDHVLVGLGTDDTASREAIAHLSATIVDDDAQTFEQAGQMTALAHIARGMGADWVVPFDADEIWCSTGRPRLADTLEALPDEILIAEAKLFDHKVTPKDPRSEDPVIRMGWRNVECAPLRKVAVRALNTLELHGGQHSAGYTDRAVPPAALDAIQVRHYPYRSAEQLIRKIRIGGPPLAASGMSKNFGAHWRMFYEMLEQQGEQSLVDWFMRWAYQDDPQRDPEFCFDPCPV